MLSGWLIVVSAQWVQVKCHQLVSFWAKLHVSWSKWWKYRGRECFLSTAHLIKAIRVRSRENRNPISSFTCSPHSGWIFLYGAAQKRSCLNKWWKIMGHNERQNSPENNWGPPSLVCLFGSTPGFTEKTNWKSENLVTRRVNAMRRRPPHPMMTGGEEAPGGGAANRWLQSIFTSFLWKQKL